jgi:hypothetical protein
LFNSFSHLSVQTPWLEYLDYVKVREEQCAAVREWEVTHFRTEDHTSKVPVLANAEDSAEPDKRILKR